MQVDYKCESLVPFVAFSKLCRFISQPKFISSIYVDRSIEYKPCIFHRKSLRKTILNAQNYYAVTLNISSLARTTMHGKTISICHIITLPTLFQISTFKLYEQLRSKMHINGGASIVLVPFIISFFR